MATDESGSQSSQELLSKLDELLKECTPLEESPGEQGYGLDYAARLEEMRKVSAHSQTHTFRPVKSQECDTLISCDHTPKIEVKVFLYMNVTHF